MNKNFQGILIVGGVICAYFIWKASKTPNDVNLDQPLPDETDADGNIVGGKDQFSEFAKQRKIDKFLKK